MATQLLAVGATAANSADLVITSGSPITIGLKGVVDGGACVRLSLKDDEGNYQSLGFLTAGYPVGVLNAPGTYRLSRLAGSPCGVYRS